VAPCPLGTPALGALPPGGARPWRPVEAEGAKPGPANWTWPSRFVALRIALRIPEVTPEGASRKGIALRRASHRASHPGGDPGGGMPKGIGRLVTPKDPRSRPN